jgi:glycosyltransferase involved in cell wall biosynthesis
MFLVVLLYCPFNDFINQLIPKVCPMVSNLNFKEPELTTNSSRIAENSKHYDIVVLSPIRWESDLQRPQQIIKRISLSRKILYVEEPLIGAVVNHTGNLITIHDNLHILQPNVSSIEAIAKLLPEYLESAVVPVGWFYSASFSPLIEHFKFETIVYDCLIKFPSKESSAAYLREQEKYLIAHADIVFASDKSVYELKRQIHENVYYFPDAQNLALFNQNLNSTILPEDIKNLQSPVVGYYGDIDSRLDLNLLHAAAKKLPNVSFVLIGALSGVTQSDMEKTSNIHYLGIKSSEEIPSYLKALDIAVLPFLASSETHEKPVPQILEYMSADKPIIATRFNDPIADYSICISLVDNAKEFCEAITFLMDKTDRLSMELAYYKILKKKSWYGIADKMKSILKSFAK